QPAFAQAFVGQVVHRLENIATDPSGRSRAVPSVASLRFPRSFVIASNHAEQAHPICRQSQPLATKFGNLKPEIRGNY
ncbi:hypothetical protein, partial [Mesorhizobium sp.]|uniref:hypothetical protein n=1 Tax=Mesorhizobium sp. TaxID=1871066 RepID=UPI002580C157